MIPNLKTLVSKLNNILVNDVHVENAFHLLNEYNGDDWKQYKESNIDTYKKKIIYQNEYYELMLISWSKNANTGFHNHPKNGCLLKVMEGCLNETFNNNSHNLLPNDIGQKNGGDEHCITTKEESYSIHIYSPPLFYFK